MNVLILSATASAINYINSLKSENEFKLFVTDCSKFSSGLYDKNVTPLLIPRSRDLIRYKESLDQIIKQYSIEVLIPTSDHDMEGVMQLLEEGWDPPVKMFTPNYNNYRLFTSKDKLIETALQKGIQTSQIYTNTKDVRFPLVIKPTREGGSKGVWIIEDSEEFQSKYELVKALYGSEIIMQEYIPGSTGSIYVVLLLYDMNGNVCGEVASKSTLTYMTWGGGGNAGEIVENPELIELAKGIINKLGGWNGPVNIEFKKHEQSGMFYLMEINCRLNGYSFLFSMNGLNFPKAVIELLVNGKTSFLSTVKKNAKAQKFVLGFREKTVTNWIV